MSSPRIPLAELSVAVRNAVEQVLSKHDAASVEKLWVGFVAPENLATSESAQKVANALTKEGNITAEASVGQLSATQAGTAQERFQPVVPLRIIGLIYAPKS
jgi:hypothetical protein